MKKNMLAMTACLLASMLAASSCGTSADIKETEAAESKKQETAAVTAAETEPPRVRADLPERDFGGETLTFFGRIYDGEWTAVDIIAKETDGELVNDAVFERTAYLEETYHVNLEMLPSNSHTLLDPFRQAAAAGDNTFDAVICSAGDAAFASMEGLLFDLNDMEHIDLSKPWWGQKINDTMSLCGHQYYATGDITLVENKGTRMFFFNKDMIRDLDLENPYTLVADNHWTIEKYLELSEAALADLNGDNQIKRADDQFGTMAQTPFGSILYIAGGGRFSEKDENGMPYPVYQEEASLAKLSKIGEMLSASPSVSLDNSMDIRHIYPNDNIVLFAEGRSLFAPDCLVHIEITFRNADIDIGLVPAPKLEESQDSYYCYTDAFCCNVFGVPVTNTEAEKICFIAEAMAADSANNVTPAYYEVALTDKYVRDRESVQMLDLIFSSVVMDNAEIFGWGHVAQDVGMILYHGKDVASFAAKREKAFIKNMEKTIEQLTAGNS